MINVAFSHFPASKMVENIGRAVFGMFVKCDQRNHLDSLPQAHLFCENALSIAVPRPERGQDQE